MTPTDVVTAITTTLTTAFPGWTVEAHGGAFVESELPLLLAKIPCLLVGVLGIPEFRPQGPSRFLAQLDCAVTVFGRDDADLAADRATLALATVFDLLTRLPGQRWSLAGAKPPDAESIRADNLYTGRANHLRVALWSVTWSQALILAPTPAPEPAP